MMAAEKVSTEFAFFNCSSMPSDYLCETSYFTFVIIVQVYFLGIITTCGIFGNLLSIAVFVKQRKTKSSRTLYLLIYLAFADTLYLIAGVGSRLLPTIATYIFDGQHMQWAIYASPYTLAFASVCQCFATYVLVLVVIQRYLIIAKPFKGGLHLTHRRIICSILFCAIFSICFNIPRLYEREVLVQCGKCVPIAMPVRVFTEMGENIYFNIIYSIGLRLIFRGIIPVSTVVLLTRKLIKASIAHLLHYF